MNTIRELKQQEKYKSMLKRKNKEKKIYKDKNASLQLEKQRLYIALRNKDKEIERLNNIINEVREYLTDEGVCILNKGKKENERLVWTWENYYDLLEILKGSDIERKRKQKKQ